MGVFGHAAELLTTARSAVEVNEASDVLTQTGSNPETNHWPPILSIVTFALDAVAAGASAPIVTCWLTKTRAVAWSAVADIGAAAGLEPCQQFLPGPVNGIVGSTH